MGAVDVPRGTDSESWQQNPVDGGGQSNSYSYSVLNIWDKEHPTHSALQCTAAPRNLAWQELQLDGWGSTGGPWVSPLSGRYLP